MSEDGAALPRDAADPQPVLPWEGKAKPADRFLLGAIMLSGLYLLALMPLTPSLLAHPVLLELLKGSVSGDGHDGRAWRGSARRRCSSRCSPRSPA